MAPPQTIKAAFIDRDGTIIVEKNYLRDPSAVQLLPGAVDGLKKLSSQGYRLFVVSNQSGVGRGLIKLEEHEAVHTEFSKQLEIAGVKIEAYFYCLHTPDAKCDCRKPHTALIPKAWPPGASGTPIDFKQCLVIGDKLSDLMLASHLNANAVLVMTGYGAKTKAELGTLTPRIIESLASF